MGLLLLLMARAFVIIVGFFSVTTLIRRVVSGFHTVLIHVNIMNTLLIHNKAYE